MMLPFDGCSPRCRPLDVARVQRAWPAREDRIMKKTDRKTKDLERVPHPPVRKESLKDLNPTGALPNVKGGGTYTCGCSRSR